MERLHAIAVYELYRAALVGNRPPVLDQLYAFMTGFPDGPQPGHLAMEISTIRDPSKDVARLGRIARIQNEFLEEGAPPTRAWYLEDPGGGEEIRWTNAEFVRVPEAILDPMHGIALPPPE